MSIRKHPAKPYTWQVVATAIIIAVMTITTAPAAEVRGYYRSDGTYVAAYHRNNPGEGHSDQIGTGLTSHHTNHTSDNHAGLMLESTRNKQTVSGSSGLKSETQKQYDTFMSAFDRQRPRTSPQRHDEESKPKITIIKKQTKPEELPPPGTIKRDEHGRIKRSEHARNDFKKQHPCPSTGKTSGSCPGYVIDHIKALYKGGADNYTNMQWQTIAEGKAKDKWE